MLLCSRRIVHFITLAPQHHQAPMVKPNRPVLNSSRTPARTNALTTIPVLSAKDWLLTLLALILLAALSIMAHLAPYFSFELSLSQAVQQFASPTLDTLANAADW